MLSFLFQKVTFLLLYETAIGYGLYELSMSEKNQMEMEICHRELLQVINFHFLEMKVVS